MITRINLLLAIAFLGTISTASAQQHDEGINHVHEFFMVKNEAKKQIIITDGFVFSLSQGTALSAKNYEIKKLLVDQLILSMVITYDEEMNCTYKAIATNDKGEFFNDEEDTNRQREKVIKEWQKRGYSIYEYPYKYKQP